MSGTARGRAVLAIGMRIGRVLEAPFPPDLERAILMLAARYRAQDERQQVETRGPE